MSSKPNSLITLGLALALITTDAFAQEEELESVGGRGFVNFSLVAAIPTGAFKDYVRSGFGFSGYFAYGLDRRGIIGFRLDAQYVIYGNETTHESANIRGADFGVDVTTENDIISIFIGPQITLGHSRLRTYLNAGLGGSYFETATDLRSTWENEDGETEDLGGSRNFYDTTFAWAAGAGLAYALDKKGVFALELAARYIHNGQVSYLREGSIQEAADGSVTFEPIESATNLFALQLGVSLALF